MSRSVVRALEILDLLAASRRGYTLSQIAQRLDMPKSTAHNILRDLAGARMAEADEAGLYRVGMHAFEIGAAYLRATGAAGVVAPELVRLTQVLGITAHYAVLDGADAVYLCKEDPPGLRIQLASSVGARLPARSTAVGRACLAWQQDDGQQDDIAYAPVRAAGYAVDDGETAEGIRCLAAPVFDLTGCRGAIGVSYLRTAGLDEDLIAREVTESAARASAALGGESESQKWS